MANPDRLQPGDPPWLKFAFGELKEHVAETPGPKTTRRIEQYLQSTVTGPPGHKSELIPWCSAFINFVIEESTGREGTNNLAARSWLKWASGKKVSKPTRGCIVVFARTSDPDLGHVGFYLSGSNKPGVGIRVLGGNQSDRVSIVTQHLPFLGYIVPEEDLSIMDDATKRFFDKKFKDIADHAADLFHLADHGAKSDGHDSHHQKIRQELTDLRAEMKKRFDDVDRKIGEITSPS